jgi:hypothetical protein
LPAKTSAAGFKIANCDAESFHQPYDAMKPKKPLESLILTVRDHKVLMDYDLAEIYGVPTKVFNQAVKRNAARFPEDFCFRLTLEEAETAQRSRSQFVTLKRGQNIKYLPSAFTEHGIQPAR